MKLAPLFVLKGYFSGVKDGWSFRQWLRVLLVGLGLWPVGHAVAQSGRLVRIMSWNVENLFDCDDNPATEDDAFLPDSPRRWTHKRLNTKLTRLGKTFVGFPDGHIPDLIALQEVENDSVLTRLTRYTPLRHIGYEYLITHSLDRRGINVALLYRPEIFRVLSSETLRFDARPTRDVLSVTGRLNTGDTICVIVCHLPSKLQGRAGDRFRQSIADSLGNYVARRLSEQENLRVVIVGDMNSLPTDRTWSRSSRAKSQAEGEVLLRNLAAEWKAVDKVKGTYKYNGRWQLLDQCLVSDTWDERWELSWDVVRFDWLLSRDQWGEPVPRRAYNGYRYVDGISDHLPTYLDCRLK